MSEPKKPREFWLSIYKGKDQIISVHQFEVKPGIHIDPDTDEVIKVREVMSSETFDELARGKLRVKKLEQEIEQLKADLECYLWAIDLITRLLCNHCQNTVREAITKFYQDDSTNGILITTLLSSTKRET